MDHRVAEELGFHIHILHGLPKGMHLIAGMFVVGREVGDRAVAEVAHNHAACIVGQSVVAAMADYNLVDFAKM